MISLIVPVFNVAGCLRRCLESVCAQNCRDIQVIVIDRGSNDGSEAICDEFAQKNSNFEVYHTQHTGLSFSLDQGISLAKGESLFFLDGGDFLGADALLEIVSRSLESNSDITMCNAQIVGESDAQLAMSPSLLRDEIITPSQFFDELASCSFGSSSPFEMIWNKLYKRSLFSGICFAGSGEQNDDGSAIHKVFFNANRITCISSVLYFRIQGKANPINALPEYRKLESCEMILKRDRFFESVGLFDFIEKDFIGFGNEFCDASIKGVFSYGIRKKAHRIWLEYKEFYLNLEKTSVLHLSKRQFLFFRFFGCYFPLYILGKMRGHFQKQKIRLSMSIKLLRLSLCSNPFVLLMVPDHGNLGDQAILLAESGFFHTNFPKNHLFLFNDEQYEISKDFLLKPRIQKKCRFFVHGGGFLGSLWPKEELFFEDIVSSFSIGSVFVLPQSVFFSSSFQKKHFLFFIQKYHPILCLREETSFSALQDGSDSFQLIPDMVLLNPPFSTDSSKKRQGVLLCLRNDAEKTVNSDFIAEVTELLDGRGVSYSYTDTVIDRRIDNRNRSRIILSYIRFLSGSRLVITDRLHGMVFAWLSKTPCIVVNSKSPKVRGTFSWIKSSNSVVFCDRGAELPQDIDDMLGRGVPDRLIPDFHKYSNQLSVLISEKGVTQWNSKTRK